MFKNKKCLKITSKLKERRVGKHSFRLIQATWAWEQEETTY